MTVSTTSRTTTYTGNGVTTTFATDFQFLLETDLVVTVDGVTKNLNSNYTVTGGDGSSGSVVFLAAPANVTTIIINRLVPLTQLIDYQPNDAFDAESHEQALDKLTQIEQQQQSTLERTFRVGPLEAEVAAISGDIGSKYLYLNAGKQLTAVTGDPTQPITHTTEYYYPTAGETVVPVSAYTQGSGDLSVFVNGVLQVLTVDYAETSNASVTMVTPLADGDVVILSIGDVFSVTLVSPGVSEESITGITTSTLTLTTMTYQPGVDNVWVFFNGSKLSSTDYTETNSTTITLGFTPVAGDVMDVVVGQAIDAVSVSRPLVGTALYPRTAAEIALAVTPIDYAYAPGDVRRYGTNTSPGSTNMTTPIANALVVSASHRAVFQAEIYLTGKQTPPTGADIYLPVGCVLQAISTLGATDRLINILYDNVHIVGYGAVVEMIRAHYATGEQRHGVFIYGPTNTVIEGLTSRGCGGDGFYVGGAASAPAIGTRLINCKGINNRRQGLSVVNARNFRDIDGEWTTSNGTAPSAGIDIEPNSATDVLEDIKIIRPRCTGNDGAGIGVFLYNWNAITNYADIEIIEPYTSGNGLVSQSGRLRPGIDLNRVGSTTPCRGRIAVIDPKCVAEQVAGIHVYDWDVNGPRIEIIRPTVINPNVAAGSTASISGGIILYNSTTYTAAPGNVYIERPLIRDDGTLLSANSLATIRVDGLWTDVEITDPRYGYSGNPWSIGATARVRFSSVTPIPVTVATGTTTVADGRYLGRVINNTGAGSQSTVALIAASTQLIGIRQSFEVTAAQELRIDPNGTNLIRGGTAGQYMTSTTIGDTATLEMDTATTWKIVARHGTWTYV